jgi:hypothetical protein
MAADVCDMFRNCGVSARVDARPVWVEQHVHARLLGIDGPQAPALRKGGTTELLDGLASYLSKQPRAGAATMISGQPCRLSSDEPQRPRPCDGCGPDKPRCPKYR